MNFAVLASGRGGNLQAIISAVKKGVVKANLSVVISDKADAHALTRARNAGIKAVHINPKDFKTREAFDREVVAVLKDARINFVVLAGYMRLLSGYFIQAYSNKILNIHPALLPAFKGTRGIEDAFVKGVKVTGVTVHFVIEEVDAGAIILQEPVLVRPNDTRDSLAKRIHAIEHKIYPKAIGLFAQGKLHIIGGKVVIK